MAGGKPRSVLEEKAAACPLNDMACKWDDTLGWLRGDDTHPECLFCRFSRGPGDKGELYKAWVDYQ